jgi:VanZ family protein
MRVHNLISIAAWAFLTFVAFATLSPYAWRPELTETEPGLVVILEHVGAFAVLGFLFVVGYPERPRTVCFLIGGSAIALEFAQALVPDRHARLADVLEKIVGGAAGILFAIALLPAVMSVVGLSPKVDHRFVAKNFGEIDGDVFELVIGFCALLLFALALVIFRNLVVSS